MIIHKSEDYPRAVYINEQEIGVCVWGDAPEPGTFLRVIPTSTAFYATHAKVVEEVKTPADRKDRMTFVRVVWEEPEQ